MYIYIYIYIYICFGIRVIYCACVRAQWKEWACRMCERVHMFTPSVPTCKTDRLPSCWEIAFSRTYIHMRMPCTYMYASVWLHEPCMGSVRLCVYFGQRLSVYFSTTECIFLSKTGCYFCILMWQRCVFVYVRASMHLPVCTCVPVCM